MVVEKQHFDGCVRGASIHTGQVQADWRELADAASLRMVMPRPTIETIVEVERALGWSLSRTLRDLYAHCDGLVDEWGYECVLPIVEVGRRNQEFRARFG